MQILCKNMQISCFFQLICPPEFKRSDYYGILCELIPELEQAPPGDGRLNTDTFPKLRNLIIFNDSGAAENSQKGPFNGAWDFEQVLSMGTAEDCRKLEQLEASVQPDDPANIQYTSVSTTIEDSSSSNFHHQMP
jgi:fatty-acyl-CoA synthase